MDDTSEQLESVGILLLRHQRAARRVGVRLLAVPAKEMMADRPTDRPNDLGRTCHSFTILGTGVVLNRRAEGRTRTLWSCR